MAEISHKRGRSSNSVSFSASEVDEASSSNEPPSKIFKPQSFYGASSSNSYGLIIDQNYVAPLSKARLELQILDQFVKLDLKLTYEVKWEESESSLSYLFVFPVDDLLGFVNHVELWTNGQLKISSHIGTKSSTPKTGYQKEEDWEPKNESTRDKFKIALGKHHPCMAEIR